MDRVLFICVHNSARSQMAEAFLRARAGDRFEVYSAGLQPKGIHPLTRAVMREKGLDLEDQSSKSLKEYLGRVHFSYLITVCDRAREECPAVFPGVNRHIHMPFDDPTATEGTAEEKLEIFREVRDRIEAWIRDWIREISTT